MVLLTTRAGKGSPLTNTEMDANLTALNTGFDNSAESLERITLYDSAATLNQQFQTLRRGVTLLPAASAGATYFRVGLLQSTALTDVATVTRATTKTAVDQSGTVQTYASGAPAVNTAGLLVEESRTNSVLWSQQFDNAYWQKLASGTATTPVVTADQGVAPDGTVTADRVQLNIGAGTAGTDNARVVSTTLTGLPNPHAEALSIWLKSFTGQTYTVRVAEGFAGISTLAVVGPTWQKFSISTASSANASANLFIDLVGNVATSKSADLLVWQGQMEIGGTFSTSDIPTTSASATRNADVTVETVSIPVGQAFTVTWKGIAPKSVGSPTLFQLGDAATPAQSLYAWYSGGVALSYKDNGIVANAPTTFAATDGAPLGLAVSVNGNTVTWSVNGAPAQTFTLAGGAFPLPWTKLALGCLLAGTAQLNSTLRELNIVMRAMSAAEVATASDVSLERDFDFTTQTYQFIGEKFAAITEQPGTTFTRATAGQTLTVAGALLNFAAGAPRATDAGLTIEPTVTNKCLNTNVNPLNTTNMQKNGDAAAVLSVVDDTSALATIGLTGNSFEVDNTAGSTTSFINISGATGNTNPHVLSVYARVLVGAPAALLFSGNGAGSTPVSGSSYARFVTPATVPLDGTVRWQMNVPAGAKVRFILNQLEELPYATTPIAVAGATATRNADILAANDTNPASFTVVAEFVVPPLPTTWAATVWAWDDGTSNNSVRVYVDSAGVCRARVVTGGVDQAILNLGAVAVGSTQKVAFAVAANDLAASRNGGAVVTSVTATLPSVSNFRFGFGANQVDPFAGVLRKIKRWRGRRTNAQLQADAT